MTRRLGDGLSPRLRGAVALDGLMEDASTAEICRAQLWQWSRHRTPMDDGRCITPALVRELLTGRAGDLLAELVTGPTCPEFLTLPAYQWHF